LEICSHGAADDDGIYGVDNYFLLILLFVGSLAFMTIFLISALTPSVKPLRLISTVAPVGMLDLG